MPLNVSSLQVCDEATTARTRPIAFCSASATTGPTSRSASRRKTQVSSLRISTAPAVEKDKSRSALALFSESAESPSAICREEAKWELLLSVAQPQSVHCCHHTHRGRPPAPRSLLCRHPALFLWFRTPLRGFLALSPRRRQPTSAKAQLTTPMSLSQTPRIEELKKTHLTPGHAALDGSRSLASG